MAIEIRGEKVLAPPNVNVTVSAVKPSMTATARPPTVTGAGGRNPLQQPFASTSIWNMPIGSNAAYVPCNYTALPSGSSVARIPYADYVHLVITPTAPLMDLKYSSANWSGASRCTATNDRPSYINDPYTRVNCPTNYIAPGNSTGNDCAVFLLADGHSIVECIPFARCTAGGYGTAGDADWGSYMDLYGDGRRGDRGASRMSAWGGCLKLGELRPGQQGPEHALTFVVAADSMLYRATTLADTFRWPAYKADSGALSFYGSRTSAPFACKMGSLLALPPSVNINGLGFETGAGLQMAWNAQNYGWYIVETITSGHVAFNTEIGPNGAFINQFQSDWGLPFVVYANAPNGWLRDIQKIMTRLNVIDNNSPTTIGGGGTPRLPLAPDI